MAVINNSKYIMLLRGNKGKGREKGKMKKTEGYVVRRLEDEYLVLPSGRRTEEVNEVISLSETAGFPHFFQGSLFQVLPDQEYFFFHCSSSS